MTSRRANTMRSSTAKGHCDSSVQAGRGEVERCEVQTANNVHRLDSMSSGQTQKAARQLTCQPSHAALPPTVPHWR